MLTLSVNEVNRTAVLVQSLGLTLHLYTGATHATAVWTCAPKCPHTQGMALGPPVGFTWECEVFESLVLIYKFILIFVLHFTIFLFHILTLCLVLHPMETAYKASPDPEDMFGVVQLKSRLHGMHDSRCGPPSTLRPSETEAVTLPPLPLPSCQ